MSWTFSKSRPAGRAWRRSTTPAGAWLASASASRASRSAGKALGVRNRARSALVSASSRSREAAVARPPVRRASGAGWSSPGPSCSRCSSTRLSTGAPCRSDRVSWSSCSSTRGLCLSLPRSKIRSSGSLLLLADGLGQLGLAHAGPALDPELLGPLVQLLLGVADGVDARVGLGRALAGGLAALGRLGVGRALALLGLPVVAHLLERVLQGREGGAVRPLPLAVGLDGAVVGLAVGAPGLGRRPLQGTRQVLVPVLGALGHASLLAVRRSACYPARPATKHGPAVTAGRKAVEEARR